MALAADGSADSSGEEGRRRYALKRISCGDSEIVQVREDVVGPSLKAKWSEPALAYSYRPYYRSFWTG